MLYRPTPTRSSPIGGQGNRRIDIAGKRFGRWTVLRIHPERHRDGNAVYVVWDCVCDCGTKRPVLGTSLYRGRSTSCGCFQREIVRTNSTKHGRSSSPVYHVWEAMLQRCRNANSPNYCYYGARGIAVCEEWLSFENFYADMGDPPPGLTLERVNNDAGYGPTNCIWATQSAQNANRRRPKRKRAELDDICAYADALARAASGGGART